MNEQPSNREDFIRFASRVGQMSKTISREALEAEIRRRRPEINSGEKCPRCGLDLVWKSAGLSLCANCNPGGLWSYKTLELLAALQAVS